MIKRGKSEEISEGKKLFIEKKEMECEVKRVEVILIGEVELGEKEGWELIEDLEK